jgi:tripartite-type tricarboxylate transporter receptor subunit TctC
MGKIRRSAVLALAAVATAISAVPSQAQSQPYPSKFVRFIVTYPPGGSSDVMARILGAKLTEAWGQQVVVESKPGAAGAIGMEYAAHQPADGYTFLLGNFGPVTANPHISKVNYDVVRDFTPVSQISVAPNILVVNINAPVKSVRELITAARAQPGKMTFGTSGPGSMSHLAGEMFKRLAKVEIMPVNYKGGSEWITQLMGQHIDMVFADAPPAMQNLRSGKLRAIAVTSEKRSPFTPELPTLAEEGVVGFAAANWWGILFPAGVPRPIVDKVAADLAKVLVRQDVKDRFAEFGAEAVSSTPEQFAKFMAVESVRWGKLIKEANIRIEL